jgi:hypothetical protein
MGDDFDQGRFFRAETFKPAPPPDPIPEAKTTPRQLGYLKEICVKVTPHRCAAIGENRWPTMVEIISNYLKIENPVDWETFIFNWLPFLNGYSKKVPAGGILFVFSSPFQMSPIFLRIILRKLRNGDLKVMHF